jgi:hypothetical protein
MSDKPLHWTDGNTAGPFSVEPRYSYKGGIGWALLQSGKQVAWFKKKVDAKKHAERILKEHVIGQR